MMRGLMVFLLLVGIAGLGSAHGQVAAYGEFSAAMLDNGPQGDQLYGGTVGVLIDGPKLFKRVQLSGDVNGRFVSKNGERLDGVTVGPRFSINPVFAKIAPFIGFNVGFARFNTGAGSSSTDNIFGGEGGITRRLTSRLDIVLDYRYEYYGYNFAMFTPQTASGGVVYHFTKR